MSNFRVNDLVRFVAGLRYGEYNFEKDSPMNLFKIAEMHYRAKDRLDSPTHCVLVGIDVAVGCARRHRWIDVAVGCASLEPCPIKVGHYVRHSDAGCGSIYQVIRKDCQYIDLVSSNGYEKRQHLEKYFRAVANPPSETISPHLKSQVVETTKPEERSLEKILLELQKANATLREAKLRQRMLKIEAKDIFRVALKKEECND